MMTDIFRRHYDRRSKLRHSPTTTGTKLHWTLAFKRCHVPKLPTSINT